ncbi:MAG: T9SS type B sorting domain-containing protein [Bacteroidetes bacterium]|nr:T9SS type B sorting domain-containing protein [Bacteroidota bacterium]
MQKTCKYALLLAISFLFSMPAMTQKEGSIWYFGYNAGLDFTRHYPKPLTDGQIHTREGVATISSSEGDLLFYTDGTTVWNKIHQVMDNGTGLAGHVTSTQSSIIVPTPHKQYEYYVFTVDVVDDDGVPGKGLNYSIVNMVLNNRLGRVFPKNENLLPICVEKITAVRHDNGEDYWIIAHGWNNATFYVYRLTTAGVSPASGGFAQQTLGAVHENTDPSDDFNRGAVGYMKASPKGDYLAVAIESLKTFELFHFDSKTGEIRALAALPAGTEHDPTSPENAAYGVEFSPTGNYLYGSTRQGGRLYRWDLSKPEQTSIRNSLEILNSNMTAITLGAIQLAFNGKIYVCIAGKQYLGVINSPTQEDCKFVQLGASLIDNTEGTGGKTYYGLPTFLPDFFKAAEFYFENTCQNDTTLFYLSTIYGIGRTPKWTIFDETGANYIGEATVNAETFEGTFQFKEPGNYIVELDVEQNGADIKQKREIMIHALPELNFTDTTVLCATKTVVLDAGDGAFYHWSDNVNLLERFRTLATEGEYAVRVTHNNGCIKFDTTQVVEFPLPVIEEIITVKASCGFNNGSAEVVTGLDPSNYIFDWKDFPDSTGNIMYNLGRGIYDLDIISKETGCARNRKVQISETGAPPVEVTADITEAVCAGTAITLTASGATFYTWTDPIESTETEVIVEPYSTTTYIVEGYSLDAQQNKCSAFAEITVDVFPYQPPELGNDRVACEGDEFPLDGGGTYQSWNWSTGESDRVINISASVDSLWIEVRDQNDCSMRDTINIEFRPLPTVDLGQDLAICRGSEFKLDAGQADEYLWNTGDTTQFVDIIYSGNFSVLVTREGCSNTDEVIITVNSPDSLRIDSVVARDISCYGANDGSILVFSKGEGSYYEYSLDGGDSWDANNGIFEYLAPGSDFSIQVVEDSACMITWNDPLLISEPDQISVDARMVSPSCEICTDGQIILTVEGGIPPYDILWSNFETGSKRKGIGLGPYSVSISDAAYCNLLTTIELGMENPNLSIPNAFTPNGDGINDTWLITALDDYPESVVTVYDRTGKLVHESSPGYPTAWDGKYNNEFLPTGSYYFVIKLSDSLDLLPGNLTIIR